MKRLLQIELKKAFGSKLFWITLALGILIISVSAYQNINGYFEFADGVKLRREFNAGKVINPLNQVFTLYNSWIGAEVSMPMNSLYYILMPLMAPLAYGWSYFTEKKSGYVKNVVTRIDKKKYYLAKYIAVFLAGGAVVAIPLLVNVLAVACVVPAYQPDMFYEMYYVMDYHYMIRLFFSMPVLYVAYVLVLDFVFAGLIATPQFGWNESCYSRNLTIRNNTFRSTSYSTGVTKPESYVPGAVNIKSDAPSKGPAGYGHRNIRILGNVFENQDGTNLHIDNAQDVLIEGNRFVRPQWNPSERGRALGYHPEALISIDKAERVTFRNNRVESPGPYLKTLIEVGPDATDVTGVDDGVVVVRPTK